MRSRWVGAKAYRVTNSRPDTVNYGLGGGGGGGEGGGGGVALLSSKPSFT